MCVIEIFFAAVLALNAAVFFGVFSGKNCKYLLAFGIETSEAELVLRELGSHSYILRFRKPACFWNNPGLYHVRGRVKVHVLGLFTALIFRFSPISNQKGNQ